MAELSFGRDELDWRVTIAWVRVLQDTLGVPEVEAYELIPWAKRTLNENRNLEKRQGERGDTPLP